MTISVYQTNKDRSAADMGQVSWRKRPDLRELVKTMWIDGKTGGEIVRHLRETNPDLYFTRNKVIGLIFRMKLPHHAMVRSVVQDRKPRVQAKPKPPMFRVKSQPTPVALVTQPRSKPVVYLRPSRPEGPRMGKTITQLGQFDCRWIDGEPYGDIRYCGDSRVEGQPYSYCDEHLRRVLRHYNMHGKEYVKIGNTFVLR